MKSSTKKMSKKDREHFQVAYTNGKKELWEEMVVAKQEATDAKSTFSPDERLNR